MGYSLSNSGWGGQTWWDNGSERDMIVDKEKALKNESKKNV